MTRLGFIAQLSRQVKRIRARGAPAAASADQYLVHPRCALRVSVGRRSTSVYQVVGSGPAGIKNLAIFSTADPEGLISAEALIRRNMIPR